MSIVVPVYNSERFLQEAIESILNQTYKNLEIIIVDDGSTDNSSKIIKNYSDRIKFHFQPNQGLSSALNAGLKMIHGKWFKWFSPDDILSPNAIEILVDEVNKLDENTIVYSNWEIIDESGKKLRDFSESNFNELEKFDFNVRLLDGQQINVNTSLIPTKLFEKGYSFRDLEDPVAIDYDFFLQAGLLYDTRFFLIPKPLIKYRINKAQLSHRNITKTLSTIQEVKNEILSKLSEEKRENYLNAIKNYNKKKTLSKKTLELGLKFTSKILPDNITDKLIVFYLNKIRRTR